MEKLKRNKKYKAVSADVTINKIRNILFENKIVLKEIYNKTAIESLKSCYVEVVNEGVEFLKLRTNGKGMSFEYSLASALAEFMERLQNNLIFKSRTLVFPNFKNIVFFENNKELIEVLEKEGLVNDFLNAPDEVFLLKDEILDKIGPVLHKMLNLKKEQDVEDIINEVGIFDHKKNVCLPFFNLNKKKVEPLPYAILRMIYGSNGMAAGNNVKEAFIQGLCEIFERYAMRKIYLENVELPDIPKDYFIGEKIYDLITEVEEKKKITVIIKDCSCGIGLPVVGLILIDKIGQRYTFHLGSDPSPITALERCLTEINQGDVGSFNAKFKDIKSGLNYLDAESYEYTKEEKIMCEFLSSMKDGTGHWPNYIFNVNDNFKGFSYVGSDSDEEDIKNLLKIISDNNFEVFVRDVSILGFPSLQIVIPGMSEMFPDYKVINKGLDFSSASMTLFRLKEASTEEIKHLALALKSLYFSFPEKNDNTLKNYYSNVIDPDLSGLTVELFLTMLFYRAGDLKNALYFINRHIKEVEKYNNEKDLYIYCARDFIDFRLQGIEINEITRYLLIFHDAGLVDEILKDFSNPQDIFNYYNFPVCFNCEKCQLKEKCKYLDIIRFSSKIDNKRKDCIIDQNNLIEILN